MDIKQATVSIVLDSAEVAEAIKPYLEAQFSQLGVVVGMKLSDVGVEISFGSKQEAKA